MQVLGIQCSIYELLEIFQNISNQKIKYDILEIKNNSINISCANIEKIQKELKWKPKEKLEEICKNIWFYFKM